MRTASPPGASRKRKAAGNTYALDILNSWANDSCIQEDFLVYRLAGDAAMRGQVCPYNSTASTWSRSNSNGACRRLARGHALASVAVCCERWA